MLAAHEQHRGLRGRAVDRGFGGLDNTQLRPVNVRLIVDFPPEGAFGLTARCSAASGNVGESGPESAIAGLFA